MSGIIFISYRRGDSRGSTGRLYDILAKTFTPEKVFLDVDNIDPGLDFVDILQEKVNECDVFLAVIGQGWVNARDAEGRRRLENPDDFVRIEISRALALKRRVIPVLVDDASMPRADQLPSDLQALVRRHAVSISHDRFHIDTERLARSLKATLGKLEEERKASQAADLDAPTGRPPAADASSAAIVLPHDENPAHQHASSGEPVELASSAGGEETPPPPHVTPEPVRVAQPDARSTTLKSSTPPATEPEKARPVAAEPAKAEADSPAHNWRTGGPSTSKEVAMLEVDAGAYRVRTPTTVDPDRRAGKTGETRSTALASPPWKVILASLSGTVLVWYDFYLYGSLAALIGANFFSQYPEAPRNFFALLAFAAGFLVRPFGALLFGRIGDRVGRKYSFLVAITIMGLSTFLVGLLPGSASWGIAAPIILIALRMLQGLALGGEYGGAATYVAEHAPDNRRGFYTSWIQTAATLGLFLSLIVILIVQNSMSTDAFRAWGWRVPFLLSFILLGISAWTRLSLDESPIFQRMKDEGKGSKAPLSEAFGQWKNARIALLALFGLTAGQAVVWYSGQFYALFFLQNVLKVEAQSVNIMIAIALALGIGFFVFFGWLSDRIGRKPIIMAGLLLAIVTYFPLFGWLADAANPALTAAQASTRATVTAAPGDCKFQFNPVGTAKFTTSCDIATSFLTRNSVPYDVVAGPAGSAATVKIGNKTVQSFDVIAAGDRAAGKTAAFNKAVNIALQEGGYPLVRAALKVADQRLDGFAGANPELKLDPADLRGGAGVKRAVDAVGLSSADVDALKAAGVTEVTTYAAFPKTYSYLLPTESAIAARLVTAEEAGTATGITVYNIPASGAFAMIADPAQVSWFGVIAVLFILVLYVTMVYGPIAAILVEMFPTRIRYTGMSLPYHIGNGWFGGLLPAVMFALGVAAGDIYYGLWYPIIIAAMSLIIGSLFVRDTLGTNLHSKE